MVGADPIGRGGGVTGWFLRVLGGGVAGGALDAVDGCDVILLCRSCCVDWCWCARRLRRDLDLRGEGLVGCGVGDLVLRRGVKVIGVGSRMGTLCGIGAGSAKISVHSRWYSSWLRCWL